MNERKRPAARIGILLLLCAVALAALTPRTFSGERATHDAKSLCILADEAVFYVRTLNEQGQLKSDATGFAASPTGLAFTATHAVGGAADVRVVLPSGETLDAVSVVYADAETTWRCCVCRQEKRLTVMVIQLDFRQ